MINKLWIGIWFCRTYSNAWASASESIPCASGLDDRHPGVGQYLSWTIEEADCSCARAAAPRTVTINTRRVELARLIVDSFHKQLKDSSLLSHGRQTSSLLLDGL